LEDGLRFLERDPVLPLVLCILGVVPLEAELAANNALQQARSFFSSVAVRGRFGATPIRRELSSAAGAAQLGAFA
jgi:hypothetical protein